MKPDIESSKISCTNPVHNTKNSPIFSLKLLLNPKRLTPQQNRLTRNV